jgi:hypothetical protein
VGRRLRQQLLRRRAADQGGQRGQRLRADPVVHPHAALVPVDQAGLVPHLRVVADGRLGQVERVGQVSAGQEARAEYVARIEREAQAEREPTLQAQDQAEAEP